MMETFNFIFWANAKSDIKLNLTTESELFETWEKPRKQEKKKKIKTPHQTLETHPAEQ